MFLTIISCDFLQVYGLAAAVIMGILAYISLSTPYHYVNSKNSSSFNGFHAD